ncbi:hypothetical protein ACFFMN_33820 [Planobispora siamensis]|uniref:Uncharacterized protein n=1 Tax=Planobispora siamensis TaxID=936338 RepID=A0A8J3WJW9_9ACTN|nr:hypothetical protein [Planobispora siamensis]GIH91970.1 hypothetical protein Psi01_26000 [Planobispora siamensis]
MTETPRRYLLAGEPVTVLIRPYLKRTHLPTPVSPLLRLRPYPPNNVLVQLPDGRQVVRPFRGLRRVHA